MLCYEILLGLLVFSQSAPLFLYACEGLPVVDEEFVVGVDDFHAPQERVRAVDHGGGSSVFSLVGFFPDFRVGFVTAQTEGSEREERAFLSDENGIVVVFFVVVGFVVVVVVLAAAAVFRRRQNALFGVFDAPLESGFAGKRQRGRRGWEQSLRGFCCCCC